MVRVPFEQAPTPMSWYLRAPLFRDFATVPADYADHADSDASVYSGISRRYDKELAMCATGTSTIRFGTVFRNTHTNTGHSGVNGFNGMEIIRPRVRFIRNRRGDKRSIRLYRNVHVYTSICARTRTCMEIRFTLQRS